MLGEVKFPFSLIGLSETKIKINEDCLANINLPGYNFLSQLSLSNAGGIGFFIKDNLAFSAREYLSISKEEFEGLWIEIENTNEKLVCCVLYRHPTSNLEEFTNYLYKACDFSCRGMKSLFKRLQKKAKNGSRICC